MKIDLRSFFRAVQPFVSAQKASEQKISLRLRLPRETNHSNDNNGPIKNNIYTLHFVLSGAARRGRVEEIAFEKKKFYADRCESSLTHNAPSTRAPKTLA